MNSKTIAAYLLASSLSVPALAEWKQIGPSYNIIDGNLVYTATLQRDSQSPLRKSWNLVCGTEILGDELKEKESYERMAFTAAIAQSNADKQSRINFLNSEISSIKSRINYLNTYHISRGVVTYASQAEGMLLPALITSGTSAASHYTKIKTIGKTVALRLVNEITDTLYVPDEGMTTRELEDSITRKTLETAIASMGLGARRLTEARDIVAAPGSWDYNRATKFYTAWKLGHLEGQAHAMLLSDFIDTNVKEIITQIVFNLAKGGGIPEKLMLKSPQVREAVRQVLKKPAEQLEANLEKLEETFALLESNYTNLELPLQEMKVDHPQTVTHFIDSQSKKSPLAAEDWSITTMIGQSTICPDITILNQNPQNRDQSYNSLEVRVDDITSPSGKSIRSSDIGIILALNPSTRNFKDVYNPGFSSTIPSALCLTARADSEKGRYKVNYHLKYRDSQGNPLESRVFTKTIEVK